MDVLRPKILVVDGRQYRLNTADYCPNDYNERQPDDSERLPSYVERDGENDGIFNNYIVYVNILFLWRCKHISQFVFKS